MFWRYLVQISASNLVPPPCRGGGFVSSGNHKSWAGGRISTSSVSQAGQIWGWKPDREGYLGEENSDTNFSDACSNDISNNLKHRTEDALDGSWSWSNMCDLLYYDVERKWKKLPHLLFLGRLFEKKWREDEEEEVSSYWMALRKREDSVNWKSKY
jgi:alpha-tubulin suppressor-like RCC1 family protein